MKGRARRIICTVVLALAVTIVLVGVGAASQAASTSSPSAAAHHQAGLEFFSLGHYEDAVSEFRKAYEVEARPDFLLQIGRSYDRLKQTRTALYFFNRYLLTSPADAPERQEAQTYVDKVQAETATARLAPHIAEEPKEAIPLWHRWWFWTIAGAVAVVGIGFAVTRTPADSPPASDLGHMSF